ncbi:MAG: hypothetical protein LBB95_00155 [Mycoplasmataceae bacterium]|jgi:hypothetical protein|nr:hypothetical protein [Mycoplasmataceae bacterium]
MDVREALVKYRLTKDQKSLLFLFYKFKGDLEIQFARYARLYGIKVDFSDYTSLIFNTIKKCCELFKLANTENEFKSWMFSMNNFAVKNYFRSILNHKSKQTPLTSKIGYIDFDKDFGYDLKICDEVEHNLKERKFIEFLDLLDLTKAQKQMFLLKYHGVHSSIIKKKTRMSPTKQQNEFRRLRQLFQENMNKISETKVSDV